MQGVTQSPRNTFTSAEVLSALSFSAGARIRHGVEFYNSSGVLISPQPAVNVVGGEVSYSYTIPDTITGGGNDFAPVQRTATLDIVGTIPASLNILSTRFKPWVEILISGNRWVRFYVGLFVSTMPTQEYDGVQTTHQLQLADISHVWANKKIVNPVTVRSGTVVTTYIKDDLLNRFGVTDTTRITASTKTLTDSLVFEADTSWLEIYNTMLQHIGYDPIGTTTNGQPQASPAANLAAKSVEWTYGQGGTLIASGSIEPVDPELPNELVFVSNTAPSLAHEGNGWRTVRNYNDGPASINQRGTTVSRRIEVEAKTQTELDSIAAFEAQRIFAGGGLRYSGQVGLNPLHEERDVIAIHKPSMGLLNPSGEKWLVTSWTLPLRPIQSEADVLMSITAERYVTATLGA